MVGADVEHSVHIAWGNVLNPDRVRAVRAPRIQLQLKALLVPAWLCPGTIRLCF